MLKRKLKDGTVVGLSLEAVQGGVLLTLDNQDAKSDIPKRQLSFMLNPIEVAKCIDGMKKSFVRISSAHGRTLTFDAPLAYMRDPIVVEIAEGSDVSIQFPLREHEVHFVRKALESMAASLLFVGTWSGEPEEL